MKYLWILMALLLAACGAKTDDVAPAMAASAPAPAASGASGPPVSVTTVAAQQRDFAVVVRATGTVAPLSTVEVKSQVSSVVTQVHVKEGDFVKAGQLLFTLDARTDEANLGKARAQLAKDQATLADARRQLERSRDLLARNFVSPSAVDTAQANVDAQQAAVQADQAAIDAVRVSVGYARITAPSGGRVGAINVFPGTSVAPGGLALVTITQLDPIAVAFSLPQRHVADALRLLKEGGGKVVVTLPEARGERAGTLQFVDSAVDAASGTVKVKARFDNAGQVLWPGAYVDVTLTVQTIPGAVVVPQAALVQGTRGNLVFVVDRDSKAQPRPVTVVQTDGPDAVVEGVKPGERIALDGRQNLRPGSAVVVRDGGASAPRGARPAAGAASGSRAAP
jgi:RND family efflux transporter MFP subunit